MTIDKFPNHHHAKDKFSIHHLDNSRFDCISSVIFYFTLHLLVAIFLSDFGIQYCDLISIHIALKIEIDLHGVLGRERVDRGILDDYFLLDQGNEVLVKFLWWYLGQLEELLVCDDSVLIEEKEEEHLIGGAEKFVALALREVTSYLGITEGKFPVQ